MTLILKSDNTKNGVIPNENAKKFEEATSTSGCDSEMSEITSSVPSSFSVNIIENSKNVISDSRSTAVMTCREETVRFRKVKEEVCSNIEDVIDGFSVFSFDTENDLIKFSIQNEKFNTENELENVKCKKSSKLKKQHKFNKATKDSNCTELRGNDIYDFQATCESSPSSKTSSVNLKNIYSKKVATKYMKQFKNGFKLDCSLSTSEENSSSASVTEFRHHTIVDSPLPTSNDDNNVVSTTTPDNGNISLEKLDLIESSDKIQLVNVVSPLKTASLRLYKLEDELTGNSYCIDESVIADNGSDINNDASGVKKVCNNSNAIGYNDEINSEQRSNTVSVDLLTIITEKQDIVNETDKYLGINTCNFEIKTSKKSSPEDLVNSPQDSLNSIDKQTAAAASVVGGHSHQYTDKMTSTAVINILGNNCCTSTTFRDGFMPGSGASPFKDARMIVNSDSHVTIGDEDSSNNDNNNNNNTNTRPLVTSPMQSWMELHNKGLIHQQKIQQQQLQQQNGQAISSLTVIPSKISTSSNSCIGLNSSCHSTHSTNNHFHKSQYDSSSQIDWKNNYLEATKLISTSAQKYNQNLGTLSHDLINSIRYKQEQQELLNAFRLKNETSKIPKPLVHMGHDPLYNVENSMYKNPESRFQAPAVHNYFMSNSQLPSEFNTANVFKSRSDHKSYQNSVDSAPNKDSFNKALPSLPSTNFKTPEILKKRGHSCDMHVKIAYFIYRTQKRMSILKSQELNSQLSQLIYSQKIPPNPPVPTAVAYPSGFLQHSIPYLDYRSAQLKPDHSYLNYQPKSTASAFLSQSSRPQNPYHSLIPPNLDADYLQSPITSYDEPHQSPEQKWFRLLSNYMCNQAAPSPDRPSPELLSQFYNWYQQIAQNHTNPMPHFNPHAQSTTPLDSNVAYLRKYMEQLTSCLGSMKGESGAYLNNSMSERDMHLYLLKQQQYQKALISKYQSSGLHKSNNVNTLLINPANSFYSNKKMVNHPEPLMPQYADCIQSLVNQKYRLTNEQVRQIRQDSLAHHQTRINGLSKLSDHSHQKRRKLSCESTLKVDNITRPLNDKDDSKLVTDLTGEYVNNNSDNNNEIAIEQMVSNKARDNMKFHLPAMIPDSKE